VWTRRKKRRPRWAAFLSSESSPWTLSCSNRAGKAVPGHAIAGGAQRAGRIIGTAARDGLAGTRVGITGITDGASDIHAEVSDRALAGVRITGRAGRAGDVEAKVGDRALTCVGIAGGTGRASDVQAKILAPTRIGVAS
jgi:hypothetical protein